MNPSLQHPKQRTEVRQASLVEAALQLAAKHSPAEITTGDLAEAIGISQGAVFKHFASKEAIWLSVIDWATSTLITRLQAAALQGDASHQAIHGRCAMVPHAEEMPPLSALLALKAVFMAHVDFVMTYPGVPRIIFQELQSPGDSALKLRVQSLMQRYRQLIMQLLQQAVQQRRVAPDADLQAAVVLFIGAIQGLVMQAMISGDLAAMAQQASGVFDIFEHGMLDKRPSF